MTPTRSIQQQSFGAGAHVLYADWLAPRGVCLHGNILLVADTARNEVSLMEFDGTTWHMRCVLGNNSEQRETCTASSLHYPSGIWTDGKRIAIADAWNHRVLLWHQLPTENYQAADVILGQAKSTNAEPNRTGLQAEPAANSLYWPYGVWSRGGTDLWIADTGNRRVLFFDHWPTQTGEAATRVIGQSNFTSKEYDPNQIIWPYSVKTSEQNELLITDTQYYRVHYWKNVEQAFEQPADRLFGQPNHASNGQNQFRLKPEAHTLNWCYDAIFYEGKIFIADTGNSRVLQFNPPFETNMAASKLWGQPSFQTHGEAGLSMTRVEQSDEWLYWPFSISASGHQLAVADTGKSRIIIYPLSHSI